MSKVTRKIELIPDIEDFTHEESNERCYRVFYNINNKLYKVANLLVCQLFGLDNLLSLMRLQNDEYVKCQSKLASKSISEEAKKDIKIRMEEIDKVLLERKVEIDPKHPQSFAYRAIKDSDYAKGLPSDILNTLKQDVFKHFNETKKEQLRGKRSLTTYKRGIPISRCSKLI